MVSSSVVVSIVALIIACAQAQVDPNINTFFYIPQANNKLMMYSYTGQTTASIPTPATPHVISVDPSSDPVTIWLTSSSTLYVAEVKNNFSYTAEFEVSNTQPTGEIINMCTGFYLRAFITASTVFLWRRGDPSGTTSPIPNEGFTTCAVVSPTQIIFGGPKVVGKVVSLDWNNKTTSSIPLPCANAGLAAIAATRGELAMVQTCNNIPTLYIADQIDRLQYARWSDLPSTCTEGSTLVGISPALRNVFMSCGPDAFSFDFSLPEITLSVLPLPSTDLPLLSLSSII